MPADQVVVGDIPAQRPGLQPRPALLARLNRAGDGPPVTVLTGGCGVGKTQLAAAYARARLAGGWRLIAWVNARESESLPARLAAVAEAALLSCGGIPPGQALRQWLEADGSRCLLVFDDAQDIGLLRPFLPAVGAARILITAAREPAAERETSVPVGVFSPEEAVALLDGRTGLADEAGAAAVAAELGHLPLALDQAATVIARQHLEYPAYLARLRTLTAGEHLEDGEEQPYPPGVAEAVLLSLESAWAADPVGVSAAVMEVTAVLSPAAVRCDLLRTAGQAGTLLGGGRRVAASMVDQALERLTGRSLLDFSVDRQAVGVHCLVARVVRDGLARRGRLAMACRAAASALELSAKALAEPPDNVPVRDLLDQVTALLDNARTGADDAIAKLASMLTRLAEAYHAAGRTGDAVPLIERLLSARERLAGADHPSTLASRNNLASAYRATGRPAEAIPLFEQNVAACQRLLGPDHPKTAASRRSLDLARRELVDQVGGDLQDDGP